MSFWEKTGQYRPAHPGHTNAAQEMKRADFTHKPVADAREVLAGIRVNATLGTASCGGMETLPPLFGRELIHRRRKRRRSHGAGFLLCVREHRNQRLVTLGMQSARTSDTKVNGLHTAVIGERAVPVDKLRRT
jgi:hypothetical protein